MFDLSHDLDPITPSGGELLAEIGIDARHIRDALADEPSPALPRPRGPGERGLEGSERTVNGAGAGERSSGPGRSHSIVINQHEQET